MNFLLDHKQFKIKQILLKFNFIFIKYIFTIRIIEYKEFFNDLIKFYKLIMIEIYLFPLKINFFNILKL